MKPLTIGDSVLVAAVSELGYYDYAVGPPQRAVGTHRVEPFMAVIVGQARKQIGRYVPATQSSWDGDYEPPSLKVDKVVTLWEVRTGLRNKPILVRDEDLEASDKYSLPMIGPKPRRLAWQPMNEAPRTGETILALFEGEEVQVRWAEYRSDPGLNHYGEGWEDALNHYAVPDEGFEGWREL